MAFMDQQRKKRIAEQLKLVIPKTWKWSLAVYHHTTITLTIKSAGLDLVALNKRGNKNDGHIQLNEFYLEKEYDGELLDVFKDIRAAINCENHDRSDAMTDYFDVGYFVYINLGKWNKPFEVK